MLLLPKDYIFKILFLHISNLALNALVLAASAALLVGDDVVVVVVKVRAEAALEGKVELGEKMFCVRLYTLILPSLLLFGDAYQCFVL